MTTRGRVDRDTARLAAMNVALLTLVLRPVEPLSKREFEAIVAAVAVVLAVAERRRAGDRRG
jgi:hypothetical protein